MVAAVEPVPGLGSCGSACFSTSQPPLPRPAAAFSPSSLGGVVDGALARMLADALDAFDEPDGGAVGARGVLFVLGKIASHRERLSANMSPVSEPNDDSDSLPDMS